MRDWRPGATADVLQARAQLLAAIRRYFKRLDVLEVETPLLGATAASDPHLDAVAIADDGGYLQTSPEHYLKRLLAAGSGPVYQLGKAFRSGEDGAHHNREFTMLEWYRPRYGLPKMIAETGDLLCSLLGKRQIRQTTYAGLFRERLEIDPHRVADDVLRQRSEDVAQRSLRDADRDAMLDLLWATEIEPQLGQGEFSVVTEWPASQAALAAGARDREDNPIALRFEVYGDGLELANGYDELRDPQVLRQRYRRDCERRRALGKPLPPLDHKLLAAMEAGLPRCAGVAMGVDRVLMLKLGAATIDEVLAFSTARL